MAGRFWDEPEGEQTVPDDGVLNLELAQIGSRALALLIDLLIRYSALLLVFLSLVLGLNLNLADWVGWFGLSGGLALLIALFYFSEWFYGVLFEWLWDGQTPGKRLVGLRVVRLDGLSIGFFEALARNLTRPLDSSPPLSLVGMLFILFHQKHQRPGDLLAKTIVVREGTMDWSLLEESRPLEGRVREPLLVGAGSEELEWLHRFWSRRTQMEPEHRARMAEQVLDRLRPRLRPGWSPPRHLGAEEILAEVMGSL